MGCKITSQPKLPLDDCGPRRVPELLLVVLHHMQEACHHACHLCPPINHPPKSPKHSFPSPSRSASSTSPNNALLKCAAAAVWLLPHHPLLGCCLVVWCGQAELSTESCLLASLVTWSVTVCLCFFPLLCSLSERVSVLAFLLAFCFPNLFSASIMMDEQ